MAFLVEIILKELIANVLGIYTRFYFFKLIGKPKSIKYLWGELTKKDNIRSFEQGMINIIVGVVLFISLSISIAYLAYS